MQPFPPGQPCGCRGGSGWQSGINHCKSWLSGTGTGGTGTSGSGTSGSG